MNVKILAICFTYLHNVNNSFQNKLKNQMILENFTLSEFRLHYLRLVMWITQEKSFKNKHTNKQAHIQKRDQM